MKKKMSEMICKAHKKIKTIMLIAVSVSLAAGLSAQQAELKSEVAENEKVILKVENASEYQWYLLYQINEDGTYTYLEAQASDGSDIKFTSKGNNGDMYEVFQYAQMPQPIPDRPEKSFKIRNHTK